MLVKYFGAYLSLFFFMPIHSADIDEQTLECKLEHIGSTLDLHEAEKLVKQGVDIKICDKQGDNIILGSAIRANNCDKWSKSAFIEFLLENGAELNPKLENQEIPLLIAAERSHSYHIIELFLKKGANINAINQKGQSVLHVLAARGKRQEIKFLLTQKNTIINQQDHQGRTPLMKASAKCYFTIVGELLKHGADSLLKDKKERIAFDYAISWSEKKHQSSRLKTMKILLQYDKDNQILHKIMDSYKKSSFEMDDLSSSDSDSSDSN